MKLIGSNYIVPGKVLSNWSIHIEMRNFMSTVESLLKFSVLAQMSLTLRSALIKWFNNCMLMPLSILIIDNGVKYLSYQIFKPLLSWSALLTIRIQFLSLPSIQSFLVKTGTLASASLLVSESEDMTPALNVKLHIVLKTLPPASPLSLTGIEKDELVEASEHVNRATEGPYYLAEKWKTDENLELLRYHRGYSWANSDKSFISPSAFFSEIALPLPMPPNHLFDKPKICATLHYYENDIKVETPFNINILKKYLQTYSNHLLVDLVLWGLYNGFWPLDEGNWNIDEDGIMDNYSANETDFEVIKRFHDKETNAGWWSNSICTLLSGMKILPIFVNWRDSAKSHVVTDHMAFRLNDGIPKAEAKVRYDDMHNFGQILHDIYQQFLNIPFVLYKSDVSSVFLNLPAHPIW